MKIVLILKNKNVVTIIVLSEHLVNKTSLQFSCLPLSRIWYVLCITNNSTSKFIQIQNMHPTRLQPIQSNFTPFSSLLNCSSDQRRHLLPVMFPPQAIDNDISPLFLDKSFHSQLPLYSISHSTSRNVSPLLGYSLSCSIYHYFTVCTAIGTKSIFNPILTWNIKVHYFYSTATIKR